ncbi:hypothetical protein [Brachybacterium sp.]|uniref:hypothetical protein n=1 Tax=Brachybacterium sp. TaxID=1891286 RepID=UPI00264803C0|nr:hypothetical protein [Brachybacterium sp.]
MRWPGADGPFLPIDDRHIAILVVVVAAVVVGVAVAVAIAVAVAVVAVVDIAAIDHIDHIGHIGHIDHIGCPGSVPGRGSSAGGCSRIELAAALGSRTSSSAPPMVVRRPGRRSRSGAMPGTVSGAPHLCGAPQMVSCAVPRRWSLVRCLADGLLCGAPQMVVRHRGVQRRRSRVVTPCVDSSLSDPISP